MKVMARAAISLACAAGVLAPVAAQQLTGAGATFPFPIYSKWFDAYHQANPGVTINYQSIGSGGGIQQLKAGTVDFGASDAPLSDAGSEVDAAARRPHPHGRGRGGADLQRAGRSQRA